MVRMGQGWFARRLSRRSTMSSRFAAEGMLNRQARTLPNTSTSSPQNEKFTKLRKKSRCFAPPITYSVSILARRCTLQDLSKGKKMWRKKWRVLAAVRMPYCFFTAYHRALE